MRLTRFSDNAMRCLLVLGLHSQEFLPVNSIAVQMEMSHEHLVKVIHKLSELGYVETQRGRHGGVRLRMSPEQIRFGALIRATEGTLALVECFEEHASTCPVAPACRLAPMLDRALGAFLQVLDGYTLADALINRAELVPLLRRHEDTVHDMNPAVRRAN